MGSSKRSLIDSNYKGNERTDNRQQTSPLSSSKGNVSVKGNLNAKREVMALFNKRMNNTVTEDSHISILNEIGQLKKKHELEVAKTEADPNHWLKECNKIPILGIQLVNYATCYGSQGLVGKELGEKLWGEVANNIYTHTDKHVTFQEEPLRKMLRQYYLNLETDQYIKKGFSYGVGIKDHGKSLKFREQVDDIHRRVMSCY